MSPEPRIESAIPPPAVMRIANPMMRMLLRSPLHGMVSGFMMLLDFAGRKSGRRFLVPVSYHVLDGVPTAFSGAPWVANLRGEAPFHVIQQGVRRAARAEIVDDPSAVAAALHRVLTEIGPSNASRFAFKISGDVPPPEKVQEALQGRKMLRLHPGG